MCNLLLTCLVFFGCGTSTRWRLKALVAFESMLIAVDEGEFMRATKDGNGQGMIRVEQYHTHTRIANGYKFLAIPVSMDIKLYPYPVGTRTHWVPGG
jgi:hypothetical protein